VSRCRNGEWRSLYFSEHRTPVDQDRGCSATVPVDGLATLKLDVEKLQPPDRLACESIVVHMCRRTLQSDFRLGDHPTDHPNFPSLGVCPKRLRTIAVKASNLFSPSTYATRKYK